MPTPFVDPYHVDQNHVRNHRCRCADCQPVPAKPVGAFWTHAGWAMAGVALVLLVLWLSAGPSFAKQPRPIPAPAALVKARAACPVTEPARCRAALVRAYEAIRWQRNERLTHRSIPAAASRLTPLEVGRALARRRAWGDEQFSCLARLWGRESGWRVSALNHSSGAAGIPQALPGRKMRSAGPDWRTNPATQITWGLRYISARYGTPCAALKHSDQNGWY